MNFVRGLLTFVAVAVALYALWWAYSGMMHGGWSPPGFGGSSGSGGGGIANSAKGFGKSLGCSWGGNC